MEKKTVSAIMLTLLLTSMLTLAFNIQTAKAESELQIVIGTTDSVEWTLDPAQAYDYFGWCILQQIAGTLVSVKPGSTTGAEFVPELAESWSVSGDSTIWDFTLRQGITFPDGTEFNATHVKYSFDRAITLIPSIPEGAPAGLGYDLIINRIEVLSTYKVRFSLNFPFSPFLGILACRASAIVDPKYAPIAQVDYTAGDPRASTSVAFIGPYNLSRWERVAGRDIEIKLDANPHYWNATSGYPKIKHMIFRFYSDSSSLRSAIDTGDVDMAFRYISPTDVLDLEDDPSVKVWWGTGSFIQYLCFQEKRAPFNDTRVRVAVAAALNRSTVCQTVFLGLASPLYSIIPPGMLGHTEAFKELGDANYTLTRSLLAELGYNEANKLKFDLWYESSGHYPMSAEQALLYKEAVEGSGVVEVTLKSADWSSYRSNRNAEIMDAFVYGWYPDYVDPDDYSFLYWASWLRTNYSNATQLALYNEARATTNLTRRAELYAQIDDIAIEQCSVVPLYVGMSCAVTKPNIHGVCLDITQDMRYWLLYIAEAEPKTWTVDDDGPADFRTIQEAINAASSEDSIYVKNGTYYENVVVNKSLSLVGENRDATIVDGRGVTHVVHVIANKTLFREFTVQNSNMDEYGIYLDHSFNCSVSDNIVRNAGQGIRLYYSDLDTISRNNISNNSEGIVLRHTLGDNIINANVIHNNTEGILLIEGHSNNISNNIIHNNNEGIVSVGSYFNDFSKNQIATNVMHGIWLQSSGYNILRANNITGNEYNLGVEGGGGEGILELINNIDTSNAVNGKPVYYWINQHGKQVPADAGYVAVINSTRIIVANLTLANNQHGVMFAYTRNSTIENANIANNFCGALLFESSNNEVLNNTVTNNENGISLKQSVANSIYGNYVNNNGMSIFLEASDSSNVTANNISDNDFGIRISYSDDVTASRNTVANNGALGYESSGINLDYSDNATVKGNIIKNNARAISLYKSTSNYLHGNNITDNEQGIWLDWYSTDNKISSNIVANNDGYGISIQTLSNATIEGNNIVNNGWGIFLFSFGNMIYHNNFINNTEQAINYHERMKNTWDAGYPSGGNFWSDYTDSDANGDGIGDTPYVIDADNQDRYPLMRPWNSFVLYGDVNGDGTVNILDVILVSKAFGTSEGDLNYDPSSDLNQDGRINVLDMILVAKHFGQHIP